MKVSRSSGVYLAALVGFLVLCTFFVYTYARRVTGTSMLPTLEEGDMVVIEPVSSASQVHLGDIVVYNPPCSATGFSVIHRVVNITSSGFTTKGDNNNENDIVGGISTGPVTLNCIEGKVGFDIPYVELVASLPYGTNYLLAVLIVVLVAYSELRGNSKPDMKEGDQPGRERSAAQPPALQ